MTPKIAPCKDCSERFPACSDKCPKDERGEYGYNAMIADLRKRKAAEKEYRQKRREDYRHSEEAAAKTERWRLRKRYGG